MELTRDFKEFIKSLNDHKVKYLLVGGYAVAAYGYPRYTGDIDFWVERSLDNSKRLLEALKDFGFGSMNMTANDFIKQDAVIQLGFPPNRIDILTGLSGLSFDECWDDKKEIVIAAEKLYVISLHHLKINKKKTNRDRDRDDLKNLP